MQNCNKFLKRLSLLYFVVLGSIVSLIILLPSLFFLSLSLVFPRARDAYYFILVRAIKIYLLLSPLKYKEKNLQTLLDSSNEKLLIVANHRSHLDMFLFLANVYKLRAIANANLFRLPFLGPAMKLSGHFPMEVGNVELYQKTMKEIKDAFSQNYPVLVFPEMTRCMPGEKGIKKYRLTAFQLARENNLKIIPVVISDTDLVWPKGKSEMDFRNKISIKALDPINSNEFSSSADLSNHIHELMEKELAEMNQ